MFFRTLVGILTEPTSTAFGVDELFGVMEKELKIGKEIRNKVNVRCNSTTLFGEINISKQKFRKILML